MLYFDTSALVKFVIAEPESAALLAWTGERHDQSYVSSSIIKVEVPRTIMRAHPPALLQSQRLITRTKRVAMTPTLLDAAAALQPPTLRSLDAIHLTSALHIRSDLTAFVTYDKRLYEAAQAAGLPVEQPI